jgi:hypothetical protein
VRSQIFRRSSGGRWVKRGNCELVVEVADGDVDVGSGDRVGIEC